MTIIFLTITLAVMLAVFGIDTARKRREFLQRHETKSRSEPRIPGGSHHGRVWNLTREA